MNENDKIQASGLNVSGKEIHNMLKELKPMLWSIIISVILLAAFLAVSHVYLEDKKLDMQVQDKSSD